MNAKHEITDLTACRAFFAGWVFLYHVDLYLNLSQWLGPFSGFIHHGYMGVDGFFMLSGLILAQVHPELAQSFRGSFKFWARRLARIYPVHLATIVILGGLFLAGLAHGLLPRAPYRFTSLSLIENLLLIHGWGFANQGTWNYPSWSVSTEWAGYLLFPGLWMLIAYFEWYVGMQFVIAGFAVLGLIVTRHHYNLNLTFGDGLWRFLTEFIIGMSTARMVPVWADNVPLKLFAGAAFCLVVLGACAGYDWLSVLGLWGILIAFVMQDDAHYPPMLGSWRVLRWLGRLSYSFYMSFAVAELLISQAFRHLAWAPASHPFTFGVGMVAVTFALASVLYYGVETPCRRTADRWLDA